MKKNEFLKAIIHNARNMGYNCTTSQAETFLRSLVWTIQDELKTDSAECRVPGIGKFSLVSTPARRGYNPATGESIDIPGGFRIKFKAAKGF